ITGRRGRDEGDPHARLERQSRRAVRLAAARAAQKQHEPHQKSMPRIARVPASKACLRLRISVTVSAMSTSSAGAYRPVAITLTVAGREETTDTTSAAGIHPQLIGDVISSRMTGW